MHPTQCTAILEYNALMIVSEYVRRQSPVIPGICITQEKIHQSLKPSIVTHSLTSISSIHPRRDNDVVTLQAPMGIIRGFDRPTQQLIGSCLVPACRRDGSGLQSVPKGVANDQTAL